jgi:hypothetical protein
MAPYLHGYLQYASEPAGGAGAGAGRRYRVGSRRLPGADGGAALVGQASRAQQLATGAANAIVISSDYEEDIDGSDNEDQCMSDNSSPSVATKVVRT